MGNGRCRRSRARKESSEEAGKSLKLGNSQGYWETLVHGDRNSSSLKNFKTQGVLDRLKGLEASMWLWLWFTETNYSSSSCTEWQGRQAHKPIIANQCDKNTDRGGWWGRLRIKGQRGGDLLFRGTDRALQRRWCLGWVLLRPEGEAPAILSSWSTLLSTWIYQHGTHPSRTSLATTSSQSMLTLSDLVFLWPWVALYSSHWHSSVLCILDA